MNTRLINIDDAQDMGSVQGNAVVSSGDQPGAKAAIDAAYLSLSPDYIVILGSWDIVPHQDLINPVYQASVDDDKMVPSDLPYCCAAPFSTTASNFMGPTRVLGRIPDATSVGDVDVFVALLDAAGSAPSLPPAQYMNYFGLTAAVWQGSTSMSLSATFSSAGALRVSPPDGPNWSVADLAPLSHFINCHGAQSDPKFYGQQGTNYPVAHLATTLPGKVTAGAIVAAECCYGAQLYPRAQAGGQEGICSAYLRAGAVAFFGSTTIAYGPSNSNDYADLLCQYFFMSILAGASCGHATLAARQRYIASKAVLDPTSIKTLAQYLLLGDPSEQPVSAAPQTKALGTHAIGGLSAVDAARSARQQRREALEQQGAALVLTSVYAVPSTNQPVSSVVDSVAMSLGQKDLSSFSGWTTFDVIGPGIPGQGLAKAVQNPSRRLHLWGRREPRDTSGPVCDIELVIAMEEQGQVVSVSQVFSR